MRRFHTLVAPALLAIVSVCAPAQERAAAPTQPAATAQAQPSAGLLPKVFAGWQESNLKTTQDPAAADPTHGALLKEYGFVDFASATYTREDRKITVKAIRFNDASGAYGAFTFYKEPQMVTEQIGEQGASANERIIFYQGNVLVQTALDRVTAMAGGELRELASMLPQTGAPKNKPPLLPAYLPKQSYVRNSARYVVGPVGLTAVGSPVGPDVVDFSKDAEIALGKYNTAEGTATVLLIAYPTPAIAGERLRAISAITAPSSSSPDLAAPFFTKRAGPVDVVVCGQISEAEARSLLASINYDADVTWNERAPNAKDNVVDFLLNEAKLVGILVGLALFLGLSFGFLRVGVKRKWPGRVFDRPEDVEIIELRLRD